MLDLSTRAKALSLYEIKLVDGRILHIKHPTQSLLMKMTDFEKNSHDVTFTLALIFEMVTDIFNLNIDGIKFKKEEIEDMLDFQTASYVLEDYLKETLNKLGE